MQGSQASRYERVLEGCPRLLERLRSASEADPYDLKGEVQVLRALLEDSIGALAGAEARGEDLSFVEVKNVRSLLKQVQGLVKDAADIEAKRRDQRLSAAHVLGLLSMLRDDLCRHLRQAYGEGAARIIDERFGAAPWTAHLDKETIKAALAAPATYDVAFRTIERDGEDITESAGKTIFEDSEAIAEALEEGSLDVLPVSEDLDDRPDGTSD